MEFIDTNVLLYAISRDDASAPKRSAARQLLARSGLAISVQVLGEFFVNAIDPSKGGLTDAEAAARCDIWSACYQVTGLQLTTFRKALENRSRFMVSYWDALILATAQELQCTILYTEDLNHGQDYGGMVVENPFRDL